MRFRVLSFCFVSIINNTSISSAVVYYTLSDPETEDLQRAAPCILHNTRIQGDFFTKLNFLSVSFRVFLVINSKRLI